MNERLPLEIPIVIPVEIKSNKIKDLLDKREPKSILPKIPSLKDWNEFTSEEKTEFSGLMEAHGVNADTELKKYHQGMKNQPPRKRRVL